jgi:hypothetical protein
VDLLLSSDTQKKEGKKLFEKKILVWGEKKVFFASNCAQFNYGSSEEIFILKTHFNNF